MKITILYDNTVLNSNLILDWGFSCLVETYNKSILFDTGANGSVLLENMKKLGIDPLSINDVFISHPHFDHVGGLSAFLNENNNVKIYMPGSMRSIVNSKEVIFVDEPAKLHENVFSTGELDNFEQSMAIGTDKGLVIITGCSHPAMEKIFRAVSPFGSIYGLIGGLHGFEEYDLLKDLGLICPCHCTLHIEEIKYLYPEKYVEGGAGRIIEVK